MVVIDGIEFENDDGRFYSEIVIPAFNQFGDGKCDGQSISINIANLEDIESVHKNTITYLLMYQEEYVDLICKAIINNFSKIDCFYATEDYNNLEECEKYAAPITNEDVLKEITIQSIEIENYTKDEFAYIKFSGNGGEWEPEHGIALVFHKENLIDIGWADLGITKIEEDCFSKEELEELENKRNQIIEDWERKTPKYKFEEPNKKWWQFWK